MLDTFVEKATDWEEPNGVTVSTLVYASITLGVWLFCAFPPYNMWSLIVPLFIALPWVLGSSIVAFHPHRQYLKKWRDLDSAQQDLWIRYKRLASEVKEQLPTMTMSDIGEMSNIEIDETNDAIRRLAMAWEQQQKLLRSPRHSQFLDTARDLTESMRESNKELAR